MLIAKNFYSLIVLPCAVILLMFGGQVLAQTSKPNILVIWGDDIGWENVSAYGMGVMGYTTPNIDRIGMEGIRFTDHYAQPSCTAGRAAFITGQYPPVQGGKSFDMSNVVQEFINKAKQ